MDRPLIDWRPGDWVLCIYPDPPPSRGIEAGKEYRINKIVGLIIEVELTPDASYCPGFSYDRFRWVRRGDEQGRANTYDCARPSGDRT